MLLGCEVVRWGTTEPRAGSCGSTVPAVRSVFMLRARPLGGDHRNTVDVLLSGLALLATGLGTSPCAGRPAASAEPLRDIERALCSVGTTEPRADALP